MDKTIILIIALSVLILAAVAVVIIITLKKGKKKEDAENTIEEYDENASDEMELAEDHNNKKKLTAAEKKKKKAEEDKKKKFGLRVPKTVQDTIPYRNMYENGIVEIEEGIFSRAYLIEDVNFKIATDEEQKSIFLKFGDLINSFDHHIKIHITIYNRCASDAQIEEHILIKPRKDGLNDAREEYNEMLKDKMTEGRNNITHEKYLTLTIEAADIREAINTFSRLDVEVSDAIKRINGIATDHVPTEKLLKILYDIYNGSKDDGFSTESSIDGVESVKSFDFKNMLKQGLTTKDIIGPASISFKNDHSLIGDQYSRALYISNFPSYMSPELIADISDLAIEMLITVHYESLSPDKAMKIIRRQLVNINSNVIEAQKKAFKSGYSGDLINPDLLKAQEETGELLEDMTSRNQKMFLVTITLNVFARSKEELDDYTKSINTVVNKYLCTLRTFSFMQEAGFNSCLPIGRNDVEIKRMLTTESASVFLPFSSQELIQNNGQFYGLNAVSRNLILYSRKDAINANGFILGTSGSGKSFTAKEEMISVLLSTDDDIFVVDPDGEYLKMAEAFGGQEIPFTIGGSHHINPFDMDKEYADKDDPVAMKSDFIGALCETIIGGKYGLTPIQKSVIDRCVNILYKDYLVELDKRGITCDNSIAPTLKDFYKLLLSQPEPEAQNLALSLELYCEGSLDLFAYRTDIDIENRFVIYNIRDIGSQLKELGLQVCLNHIWNTTISNRRKKKWTWVYLDEFHVLAATESSARFVQQMYKRFRKMWGIPTGISQNVEDLLQSAETRTILNNCQFVIMLNQATMDRIELGRLYNISPTQLSHITNSDPGQGLLYTGKTIVPFINKYPKNSSLYKAMSTKAGENLAN